MSSVLESEIGAFLREHNEESLFSYLGILEDASPAECDQALRTRRSWAQQQRTNTKFRQETDWLLRNYREIREVFVQHPERYQAMLARSRPPRRPALLSDFTVSGESLLSETETWGDPSPRESLRSVAVRGHVPPNLLEGMMRMGASHQLTEQQMALLLLDEEQWWRRLQRSPRE